MTKQEIIDIIRGCINLNMLDTNGLPGTWVNSIDGYIIAEKAADKILELYIKEKQKDYIIEMMKKDEELGLYEPKSDKIKTKNPYYDTYFSTWGMGVYNPSAELKIPKNLENQEKSAKKLSSDSSIDKDEEYSLKIKISKEFEEILKSSGHKYIADKEYYNLPFWYSKDKDGNWKVLNTNEQLPSFLQKKEPFTHVLKVIERIRDSFDDSVEVYTKGSCVKFAMILKEIFPQGVILYDMNHAIFELDNNYYDINGFAEKTDNHIPLEEYGILKAYDSMNLKYENKVS